MIRNVLNFLHTHTKTPRYIAQPYVVVDFLDGKLRYLYSEHSRYGFFPQVCSSIDLPEETISDGIVSDKVSLAMALKQVKKETKVSNIKIVLPESPGYLFITKYDKDTQSPEFVEFFVSSSVSAKPGELYYEYSKIKNNLVIQSYHKTVVHDYIHAAKIAGFFTLACIPYSKAIATGLFDRGILNFILHLGKKESVFVVTDSGVPVFSASVNFDFEQAKENVVEKINKSSKKLSPQNMLDIVLNEFSVIVFEIQKHIEFWSSRMDEKGELIYPKKALILSGEVPEFLPDVFMKKFKMQTYIKNPWEHSFDTSKFLPDIDKKEALNYSALAGVYALDLLAYGDNA